MSVKIVCTIGPASLNEQVLRRFEARDVSLVRLNLSHLDEAQITEYIQVLQRYSMPIAIDTEGRQIRTAMFPGAGIPLKANDLVKIYDAAIECSPKQVYVTPKGVLAHVKTGDLIYVDFNACLLTVEEELQRRPFILCRVLIGGLIERRKGIHFTGDQVRLPAFSEKDLTSVVVAKQHGVKVFTLSFIDAPEEVAWFRALYPAAVLYAKIETLQGFLNAAAILDAADGILIDRGDLSREIPIEKIPLVQKYLTQLAMTKGKECFVASNLLETMAAELKPSRAEANDVVNTVIDGATGFVLTKETAVGRYPVEAVNFLTNLIHQGEIAKRYFRTLDDRGTGRIDLQSLERSGHLVGDDDGGLIPPHGGKLVNRVDGGEIDTRHLPILKVTTTHLLDMEQIAIGTFSPLEGFLCRNDYESVLEKMRLSDGTVWPLPIILDVEKNQIAGIGIGQEVALASSSDSVVYGILEVEDIFAFDKEHYARQVFRTASAEHPGNVRLRSMGPILLGGRIRLVRRIPTLYGKYNATPSRMREVFRARGWSKVVGFHTRNVIHRSHEYLQMEALARSGCDGLFVHPVAGEKKEGDFGTDVIIASYEIMLSRFYPANKVFFNLFHTYSRFAGPREALFTALCRQNFGCSHFIVGRDHTGVAQLYSPTAAQELFASCPGIGIVPIFFGKVGYSEADGTYMEETHGNGQPLQDISGSEARNMLRNGLTPPPWFMRPEISDLIARKLKAREDVFT